MICGFVKQRAMGDEASWPWAETQGSSDDTNRLNRYLIIVPIKNQSRTSQLDFLKNLLSSLIKLATPLGFFRQKKISLSLYSHCGGLLLLSPCLLSGIPDHTVSLLLGSIFFNSSLCLFWYPPVILQCCGTWPTAFDTDCLLNDMLHSMFLVPWHHIYMLKMVVFL